jgi:hypothetical protein
MEESIIRDHFRTDYCYNLSIFAHGNGKTKASDLPVSEETRRRISEAVKGKRLGYKDTDEAKQRKSEAVKLRYSKMTDEEKKEMFGHSRGKKRSEYECKAISEGLKKLNRKHSDETKELIRQKATGRCRDEKSKEKQRNTRRVNYENGKRPDRIYTPVSDEVKKKISETFKRKREEKEKRNVDDILNQWFEFDD